MVKAQKKKIKKKSEANLKNRLMFWNLSDFSIGTEDYRDILIFPSFADKLLDQSKSWL